MPEVWQTLLNFARKLEYHYREMQDMEFTVEDGKLWMLQTRAGKRTAEAAVKIVVDMVKEGLLTRQEAVAKIHPHQIDNLLHPHFDDSEKKKVKRLTRGLNASPGAAVQTTCP